MSSWLTLAVRDEVFRGIAHSFFPYGFAESVDWANTGAGAAEEILDATPVIGVLGRCVATLHDGRGREAWAAEACLLLRNAMLSSEETPADQVDQYARQSLFLLLAFAQTSFPHVTTLQDAVAAMRLKLGMRFGNRLQIRNAMLTFDDVLAMDASFLPSLKGRDAASNVLVNRYHFVMLNDHIRNQHFLSAVARARKAGHSSFLDIGAGSALLSLYAAAEGASQVHAVEVCPAMACVAKKNITRARMREKVQLHKVISVAMKREELQPPPTVLVTETFDCCLLGEGCTRIISHALSELMPEDGRFDVIPRGAQLHGCIVESAELSEHLTVPAATIDGTRFPPAHGRGEAHSPETPSQFVAVHIGRLRATPRVLSSPVAIGPAYDYTSLSALESAESDGELRVPVSSGGKALGMVVWFSLDMGGGDTLHTCPFKGPGFPVNPESSCWGQAVFPFPEPGGRQVSPGDVVCARTKCAGHLDVQFVPHSPPPPRLLRGEVRMLNSEKLTRTYSRLAGMFAGAAGGQWTLVDTVGVSRFGPFCASRGARVVVQNELEPRGGEADWIRAACPGAMHGSKPGTSGYSVYYASPVLECGLLAERALNRMHDASSAGYDAVVPATVEAQCYLIESEVLFGRTRAFDENALGPRVADEMNLYGTRVEPSVDMHSLPHQMLSDMIGPLKVLPTDGFGPCASASYACRIIRDGTIHAIPFEFILGMGFGISLNTSDKDLPWHSGVVVLSDPLTVKKNDRVIVTMYVVDECMFASCEHG